MCRKIILLYLWIYILNNSFAQLPISLDSEKELFKNAKLIQKKDFHTAIRPFYQQTNDTFFLHPIIESHFFVGTDNFGIMGIGPELYLKKNKFSIWLSLPIGIAKNPQWWTNTTIPFIGKAYTEKNIKLWFDPQFIISYSTKRITFETGRKKFHLGEGLNSVWLDHYAPALPFFRAVVRVPHIVYAYHIHYLQNPDLRNNGNLYHAFNFSHYFDFNIGPLTINMFETVIQDPIDSLGAYRGLDINYLNPVIFFRAIDLMLGSPDNVLLGLGGSLRIRKKILIYGYGILDEMIISELLAGTKCWCLKYGANAGIKVFQTLEEKQILVFQSEISGIRPYTYSHLNPILAYGNLYQPLAHPLGANFYQSSTRIVYLKKEKTSIQLLVKAAIFGQDIDTLNYGKNIFRSYNTRIAETGITTTQGEKKSLIYMQLTISKKLKNKHWIRTGIIYTIQKNTPNLFFLNLAFTKNLITTTWDWR